MNFVEDWGKLRVLEKGTTHNELCLNKREIVCSIFIIFLKKFVWKRTNDLHKKIQTFFIIFVFCLEIL